MKTGEKPMLHKGRFIQDNVVIKPAPYDTGKVRIGVFYDPPLFQRAATPEERFMQDVVLGTKPYKESSITKLLGRLLRI
jgi:hypothetical protein